MTSEPATDPAPGPTGGRGSGAKHVAGDAVALVRSLLVAGDPDRADHDRLVAQVCEVVQRVLPAEDCWYVDPGALSRLVSQASVDRSAWLVNLSDRDGRVTGHRIGVLALAPVAVAGEEATLVAWRRTGWDTASLSQLAGIADLLGQAMTRSAGAQLSAVQRARAEYDALRRDLMRTINHELRTPLTAVQGALELLVETEDPDLRRRLARAADHGVRRLLRLADGVTERGASEVHFDGEGRADLVEVVSACVGAWGQSTGRVALREASSTAVEVRMDPDDLREALDRIVDNALKFSDATVEVRLCEEVPGPVSTDGGVRSSLEGETVTVLVRDRGMGIPEHEQHLVGNRFFKASNARAWEVQGPGLGLAAAMDLVRAWGGRVDLLSSPGEGTTAVLELPLAATAGTEAVVR